MKKSALPIVLCLALAGCFQSSEERAAEHLESGMSLLSEGDIDRALVEFRNTVQLDQTNIEARRQIAQINKDRGNLKNAYRNYLYVVELDPRNVEGLIALSEMAFLTRDWEEFDRHAKQAVALAPEDPAVQVINIATEYRTATTQEDIPARDALLTSAETLSSEQPDSTILRQILIDGYISNQKFDKALVEIDKTIAENPDDINLYGGKLRILAQLGDNAAIEAELRRMAERFPDDQNVNNTLLRFLVSRDKPGEALAFMRTLLEHATEENRNDVYAGLINFILSTNGPDAALAEIEDGLEKAPDFSTLKALRATIKFDMGQRNTGISELQQLLSGENNLTEDQQQNFNVTLAKMLIADGNEVGARKLIEEILADDPNAAGALKMQAVWLIEGDDTDGAITALRATLDQAPQDTDAMVLMAQAYERAGNANLKMNFLSLAVETSGNAPEVSLLYAGALAQNEKLLQAENVLINSLRITPGRVDILSALGSLYIRLEDLPRAKQVVSTLRGINTPTAQSNANALHVEVLDREAGPEEALSFLETLAKNGGDSAAIAKLALMRNRLQAGEADAALDLAKELVAENPGNPQYRNALALTYAANRDYETAATELTELLKEQPALAAIWLQLSRVRMAQGDQEAAAAAIDDGLETSPEAPDLLWGKASFLQNAGDIEGAISIYDQLYETLSSSPVVANNLASLLSTYRTDTESLSRAQIIARRLKDTDVPAFQDTYGWIRHLNGESEDAIKYLEPAAKSLPDDLSVQVHLGMVYAALNRTEEALVKLREAVIMASPIVANPLVEQAKAKIAELEAL